MSALRLLMITLDKLVNSLARIEWIWMLREGLMSLMNSISRTGPVLNQSGEPQTNRVRYSVLLLMLRTCLCQGEATWFKSERTLYH